MNNKFYSAFTNAKDSIEGVITYYIGESQNRLLLDTIKVGDTLQIASSGEEIIVISKDGETIKCDKIVTSMGSDILKVGEVIILKNQYQNPLP